MKKAKIIILTLIILLLILAGVVAVKLIKEKKQKDWVHNLDGNITLEVEEGIIPVRGYEEFFTIEKQMQNYYLYLRMGNQEAIYNLLSEPYKTSKKVTSGNAISTAKQDSGEGEEFRARQILYKDDLTKPIYLVYGVIETNHQGKECYAIVFVDNETAAFAIEPISKNTYERYQEGKTKLSPVPKIEQKKFCQYKPVTVSQEEIQNRYFEDWIRENRYHPSYAYTKLDQEYRSAKYPNQASYERYIAKKQEELASMLPEAMRDIAEFATEEEYMNYVNQYQKKGLNQYRIDERSGYTQYTFIDDYYNYYIIRVTSPMNYTVILDTYTIDLPEFLEQYSQANAEKKMQLNLGKIFSAINNEDYAYAYQKLNASYRSSNFPTQASFEEYIKQNFFEQNTIGVSEFQAYDYVYRYQVNLKDATKPNEAYTVSKVFSMTLGEGTGFEYSFNK